MKNKKGITKSCYFLSYGLKVHVLVYLPGII